MVNHISTNISFCNGHGSPWHEAGNIADGKLFTDSLGTSWPLVLILIFSILHCQNWILCTASTTPTPSLSQLHSKQFHFLSLASASPSSQVSPHHNANHLNHHKSDTSSLAQRSPARFRMSSTVGRGCLCSPVSLRGESSPWIFHNL